MEMAFKYFYIYIYMYTNLYIHAHGCGVVCLSVCLNLGKASWLFMWFIVFSVFPHFSLTLVLGTGCIFVAKAGLEFTK